MKKHWLLCLSVMLIGITPYSAHAARTETGASSLSGTWALLKLGDQTLEAERNKIFFSSATEFNLQVDCQFFKGRYQADSAQSFRIATLKSVADQCAQESKEGSAVIAALLSAEKYQMEGDSLKLLGHEDAVISVLKPSANFEMPAAVKIPGDKSKKKKSQASGKGAKGSKSKRSKASSDASNAKAPASAKASRQPHEKKMTNAHPSATHQAKVSASGKKDKSNNQ